MSPIDRLTTFRAIDAYTIEAYRLAGSMPRRPEAAEIGAEIRRSAARTGAAVVAGTATEGDSERRWFDQARGALAEGRYYLYLARRFGLIDSRSYRAVAVRLDAAMKELAEAPSSGSRRSPPVRLSGG